MSDVPENYAVLNTRPPIALVTRTELSLTQDSIATEGSAGSIPEKTGREYSRR